MTRGTLEVVLVGAKGLEDTDFLSNMDPYAIITCRTQEQKSSVASGKGTTPEWNETFLFNLSDGVSELNIKIMDSDVNEDDVVGEATIPLQALLSEGRIEVTSYNVVKDGAYCGEVRVGLTFTPRLIVDLTERNLADGNSHPWTNMILLFTLWNTAADAYNFQFVLNLFCDLV